MGNTGLACGPGGLGLAAWERPDAEDRQKQDRSVVRRGCAWTQAALPPTSHRASHSTLSPVGLALCPGPTSAGVLVPSHDCFISLSVI